MKWMLAYFDLHELNRCELVLQWYNATNLQVILICKQKKRYLVDGYYYYF